MFNSKDNQFLLTSANSIGLVSLLAYTVRTFNEVNSNLEEVRSELESLKKHHSDNNKRSNVAFNHLNTKIDENVKLLTSGLENFQKKSTKTKPKIYVKEESEEEEEEVMHIRKKEIPELRSTNDEISGALSELLGS